MSPVSVARWCAHPACAAFPLRDWLTLDTSLTTRLQSCCRTFRIKRLHQHTGVCLIDEHRAIGLSRRLKVHERDVLLICDSVPVVYAHTIVRLTATTTDWPMFRKLGNRSLGSSLFGDPKVVRHALCFAQLPENHPMMRRIRNALPSEGIESRLHARRSLFQRGRARMLVTEVFLPGIATLKTRAVNQKPG